MVLGKAFSFPISRQDRKKVQVEADDGTTYEVCSVFAGAWGVVAGYLDIETALVKMRDDEAFQDKIQRAIGHIAAVKASAGGRTAVGAADVFVAESCEQGFTSSIEVERCALGLNAANFAKEFEAEPKVRNTRGMITMRIPVLGMRPDFEDRDATMEQVSTQ